MDNRGFNRRDFLKLGVAGAGAAAVGLVGCTGGQGTTNGGTSSAVIEWDDEADVVIVGGGGAGYAGAIEALEAGCSVIVLEKTSVPGGDTRISGGMMLAVVPELQKSLNPWWTGNDTVEKFAAEIRAWGNGMVDEDKVVDMCKASPEHAQWMMDLGRVYKQCDMLPPVYGYEPVNTSDAVYAPRILHDPAIMTGHFDLLMTKAQSYSGFTELLNTEATHLIQNANGEVIGVEAEKNGVPFYYKARKGVLMAAGGPNFGGEFCRKNHPQAYWGQRMIENKWHSTFAQCTITNTGDGIRMGKEIGADIDLSRACVQSPDLSWGAPSAEIVDGKLVSPNHSRPGAFIVNSRGNRFVQEDAVWGYLVTRVYEAIVDSGVDPFETEPNVWNIVDASHLATWNTMLIGLDPDAEVAAGTLFRSDTIEGLAEQIGVNPVTLKASQERFNLMCTNGVDTDFNRTIDLVACTDAPFYAKRHAPLVMGAAGGLKIDINTQVLDTADKPIPRLYAAGMTSGGWVGPWYFSCGWAVLGTVHWGRKAGKNIAALDSWE
jgi:fumarate reductase flavoprotein subunit